MVWGDKELVTYGDLLHAVEEIAKKNDREVAQEFMRLYLAENPHAKENIGYESTCSCTLGRLFDAYSEFVSHIDDDVAIAKLHKRMDIPREIIK